MAILAGWVCMTGIRRTTPGFVHDLSIKADAHAGITKVDFAIVANGTPHSTLTANAPSMRTPNFSDRPSRMPGVSSGMAPFLGWGVGLDLSTVPAGTIVVTATVTDASAGTYTLPTTITVYNDTDGTDRRPRAVTYYCDGTDGNDANNGTSWAQAVKTFSRARNLAKSGTDVAGARIICRGTFTDLQAGTYPEISTSGSWWCEFVADAAGAYLNPPSTVANRYLSNGVGGTGSSTVICRNRFIGFRIGHNDIVAYSYGGQVHMWFDGCYAEADNYVANRLSVLYADPAIGVNGGFCGWDGSGGPGRRFYTGCSVRGAVLGYEQHQFLYDSDVLDFVGIAAKYGSDATQCVTGATIFRSQRYAARTVHGFVRMDSDAVMGKGRPACTVTIPVAGTARITGPVSGYDFSIDADDLVGNTYWGLRFEGSGATNLDTGVGLLVTNAGNDGGVPWVEVTCPGAAAGSWSANTCSFYTARVATGMNYWNIHPDGIQFERALSRDVVFDVALADAPNLQAYYTSGGLDLDLTLLDNLRDDGSGQNTTPWFGSNCTNSILQHLTLIGQFQNTHDASGWAGTSVRNCVFGSLGGDASLIGGQGATVSYCHVVSGGTFGTATNGTTGTFLAGDPATSPFSTAPTGGNQGNGSAAATEPSAWAYSGSGTTRGVMKNVGDLDWSVSAGANTGDAAVTLAFTFSATGTVAIAGAAAATLAATTSATGTNAIAGTASATLSLAGSATGTTAIVGSASASLAIAASATGTNGATNEGSANYTMAIATSATGLWVPPVPAQQPQRGSITTPSRKRRGGIWRWLPPWG